MGRLTFEVILGLAIGIIDVLLTLPFAFPDKRAALFGAFSSRFALGFFATVSQAPNVTHRIRGPGRRSHEHPGRGRYEGICANSHYWRAVRRDCGIADRADGPGRSNWHIPPGSVLHAVA